MGYLVHNQLTPVTPRRRWGTPTDASTAMTARRSLSSATIVGKSTTFNVVHLGLERGELQRPLLLNKMVQQASWQAI